MEDIAGTRICDLGLRIEGSPLEAPVARLYRELERKGLGKFRPGCYLSDEWGCPSGEPVIGIPFYLADARLARLEAERNDLETPAEIMMYLRHEAGHAFNYAYRLHRTPEWRELFGPYRRPYRDHYRPVAFSREYVRHIAGWYAQKHPDEDFAETFAVWLTPGSRWRQKYRWWGALRKLQYVARTARALRGKDPARARGRADLTVDEMELTVEEFYARSRAEQAKLPEGALMLDTDLADIFNVSPRRRRGARPAVELLREHRKTVTDKVAYWTGAQRPLVKQLVDAMETRLQAGHLRADRAREGEHVAELSAYVAALAIHRLGR
ncbi:MAG TPA: putative zinc-binding metallopeptidase [Terriglobales bacterium]|nr:putative zinc-binding metallopeptidase [Terriglobales bacterium]